MLDTKYPYVPAPLWPEPGWPGSWPADGETAGLAGDEPSDPLLDSGVEQWNTVEFEMFIMFKPTDGLDPQWVPVSHVRWGFKYRAVHDGEKWEIVEADTDSFGGNWEPVSVHPEWSAVHTGDIVWVETECP